MKAFKSVKCEISIELPDISIELPDIYGLRSPTFTRLLDRLYYPAENLTRNQIYFRPRLALKHRLDF